MDGSRVILGPNLRLRLFSKRTHLLSRIMIAQRIPITRNCEYLERITKNFLDNRARSTHYLLCSWRRDRLSTSPTPINDGKLLPCLHGFIDWRLYFCWLFFQ